MSIMIPHPIIIIANVTDRKLALSQFTVTGVELPEEDLTIDSVINLWCMS